MKKLSILLVGIASVAIFSSAQAVLAKPKYTCDRAYTGCNDVGQQMYDIDPKAGTKFFEKCDRDYKICRTKGYWSTGDRMPRGPVIKDANPPPTGQDHYPPLPPSGPKGKGKGGKFAGDESGWNGKYTTVVLRDQTGTHTITVKQGVPIELGLMVLGPNGAKYHVWDLKLAAQLEALGLTVVYANDNTARQAYAQAKAKAEASGGKKVTTRGDGSKIEQTTLNGGGANTKSLGSRNNVTGAGSDKGVAFTPPRTTASPASTNVGIVKPTVIPGPVSNNNKRQQQ